MQKIGVRSPWSPLTLALALMLSSSVLNLAYPSETEPAWSMDEEGIKITVCTLGEAYPGDNISLTIRAEAKENITNVYLTIRLQASKEHSGWETYLHPLENEELTDQEFKLRNCNFSVPAETLPGAVLGHVYCSWKVHRSQVWRDRFYEDSFQAVYLRNKDFEQLQQSYSDLNNTYHSILTDLENLQSKYEGVESGISGARKLSYCLMATTIILAGSTGFLLLKKKEQETED